MPSTAKLSTVILPTPIIGDTQVQVGISGNSDNISIESTVFTVSDNVVILNNGETGKGVTKKDLLGGFEIDRGQLPDYQVVYDESSGFLKAGIVGQLQTVPLLASGYTDGYAYMQSQGLIQAPNNDYLASITQYLSSADSPTFMGLTVFNGDITFGGQTYNFPVKDGQSGQVLSTDGQGNLEWSTGSSTTIVIPPAAPGTTQDQILGVTPSNTLKRLTVPQNVPATSDPNNVLVTDSTGTAVWEPISTLAGQVGTGSGTGSGTVATDRIYNSTNAFQVQTLSTTIPDSIVMVNGSSTLATIGASATWNVPTVYQSGLSYAVKNVTQTSYTLGVNDTIINWMCTTNGTINLPPVASCPGQMYIIQHKSTSGLVLTIVPNANDAVRSQPYETLDENEDNIRLVSDSIDNWIIL